MSLARDEFPVFQEIRKGVWEFLYKTTGYFVRIPKFLVQYCMFQKYQNKGQIKLMPFPLHHGAGRALYYAA